MTFSRRAGRPDRIDQPRAATARNSSACGSPSTRTRRCSKARPRRSAASASPASPQIQLDPPENAGAGPAAPRAPRDTLPRAEPAVRMPLWRAGHPDQAGRARPAAQHRAGAARTRLDADRAAHRIALRPQPGIDRRHPRPSRGGQPLARRALARDRRDAGRGAGRDPPGRRRRRPDRPARRHHHRPARPRRPAADQRSAAARCARPTRA